MKIQALQVGPIGTNCYIFCDEGAKVCGIVDPGGEPEVILDAVKKLGCTVDKILLTHGHYDHTGAVPALLRTLPPTAVYIHEADFDFPSPQLFPLKTELTQGALGGVSFYGEGDRITVGTLELQVLHTPRTFRGQRYAGVRGYPVLRRYALCRVLRPDGFPRRQHEGHDGLSCPSGGPARRLPGAAGTHGAKYAGAGTENKSLYADGAAGARLR